MKLYKVILVWNQLTSVIRPGIVPALENLSVKQKHAAKHTRNKWWEFCLNEILTHSDNSLYTVHMVLPSVLWLRLCCRKDLRLSLTSQRIRNQWWAAHFVWMVVNGLSSIIQTSSEFKQTTAHRQSRRKAL